MQQEYFYVSHAGHQEGPISIDEIVARVEKKTLDLSDYLYDESQKDWVVLMAYPRLAQKLQAMKPTVAPSSSSSKPSDKQGSADEWYVLKGDHRFGPFAYTELVKMLQEKSLHESDYAWNVSMVAWERLATLKEFSPEAIRKLRDSGYAGVNEVFFRRRHVRAHYGASLLIHDNHQVWKGKSIEVSAGGAGIVIEHTLFEPGQKVYLHFKPGDEFPPFNAICEVVSKRLIDSSDKNAPVQYGVRFTEISEATQFMLNDYATKKTAA